MTAAEQAATRRGITVGTEVRGHLDRPNTDFVGRVAEIYTANIEGFDVPAVKVETADGSMRYTLLGDVTLVRGADDADEPRTVDEFAAMLGDVEAESAARTRKVRGDRAAGLAASQIVHNATNEYPCTECGHWGNGQVPGCPCDGCDDTAVR